MTDCNGTPLEPLYTDPLLLIDMYHLDDDQIAQSRQTEDGEQTMPDGDSSDEHERTAEILTGLIDRAKVLQHELEAFRTRLRELRQERTVELGHFRGTVQSELNMLERLSSRPKGEATTHVARSSNLPFLESLWSTVKRHEGLVALQKRIYIGSSTKLLSQSLRRATVADVDDNVSVDSGAKPRRSGAIVVDAITEYGRVWIKISLVTNNRILFDLAKQGWESGYDSEEDDDFPLPRHEDDDPDIPLLKTAKELTKTTHHFRVRTRIPKLYMVLPRIQLGETPEVDRVIDACRATGAILICGDDENPSSSCLEDALATMAPDPIAQFTDIVNVDCTILLALVSEFSHAKVSKEPWFHPALKRQVEIEGNENLLPTLLYPAMGSRKLVATREAIDRMREIVNTIGTASEKARTRIMLGDDTTKSRADLLHEMQEWSAYAVPSDWQLPIQPILDSLEEIVERAPVEAQKVCASMTSINKAVFLYGWGRGYTTVTSNRTIVKQIERDLEQFADLDDAVWPNLWLCPTARSLVGKEKGIKRDERKDVLHLPDPLRREEQRRNGLDVLSMREGHEVEDLRPNGYDYDDVIAAKNASQR